MVERDHDGENGDNQPDRAGIKLTQAGLAVELLQELLGVIGKLFGVNVLDIVYAASMVMLAVLDCGGAARGSCLGSLVVLVGSICGTRGVRGAVRVLWCCVVLCGLFAVELVLVSHKEILVKDVGPKGSLSDNSLDEGLVRYFGSKNVVAVFCDDGECVLSCVGVDPAQLGEMLIYPGSMNMAVGIDRCAGQ